MKSALPPGSVVHVVRETLPEVGADDFRADVRRQWTDKEVHGDNYSSLIPTARIRSPQRTYSAAMKVLNASGLLPIGSEPWA